MKKKQLGDTNIERSFSRREFLAGSMAMSTVLAAAPAALMAAHHRRLETFGIQLYTVRDQMQRDVPGTLQNIARMGYNEVEFAGYFEHSPAAIAAMLGETGLTAPSAHIPMDIVRTAPETLIEAAQTIGHDYLVVSWLPPEERQTLGQYRALAEAFNRFAGLCHSTGLQFAYHNHDWEFEAIDKVLPMDLLLAETDPGLVQFELDLYWIRKGGSSALAYFDRHPGRFPLWHLKDMAKDHSMADVGSGTTDFAELFAAGEQAGLRHAFVERDDPSDSLKSAGSSIAGLRRLQY
jgi:sugar phosphate isomerase/epimerase